MELPGASAPRYSGLTGIIVEAPARLTTVPARLHIFDQQRRWPIFGIARSLMEHLADFQTHVQPNEVGKRQRPHRMIETKLNSCVNVSRSEEHTSELQSLMRISYAVFCLKNKKDKN